MARSKLAIAISKKGWGHFKKIVKGFAPYEHDIIMECLMDADKHMMHSQGAHLFFFENCNVQSDKNEYLLRQIKTLHDDDYRIIQVNNSDDLVATFGTYYNNPFVIAPVHSIYMNEDNCTEQFPEKLSF